MTQLEKIFFNGRFVEPWTDVPEGKLRDKAVKKFVQQHGVKKAMLQEYNVQKLNPKFSSKLSRLKNITNWAQTGPSPLNRILPKLFGRAATKASIIPAAISDVLLGTKITPGRSDWRLPGFADRDPSTKWYEGWGAEKVFGDKQFDGTTKSIPKPKVTQPTMRDVAGPVVEQPIHKDTAQGQGQREEQQQRQQQQQQEREKYKDTATTRAKAGYTYGLQSGGRIKRKIKKVKSKYAKGGGVRASKYKL